MSRPRRPSEQRGTKYEVANCERIPNLGEKQFLGVITEGVSGQIVAQVCDVNKLLQSVKKSMSAGNKVVIDPNGRQRPRDVDERGRRDVHAGSRRVLFQRRG